MSIVVMNPKFRKKFKEKSVKIKTTVGVIHVREL